MGTLRQRDPTWRQRARCRLDRIDTAVFFGEDAAADQVAIAFCVPCEVRPDCLVAALLGDERYGVWGGMSRRQRRALLRKLEAAV